MNRKYPVRLTMEQRQELERLISSGTVPARTLTHARMLLKSDCAEGGPSRPHGRIYENFDIAPVTALGVRKRFCEGGLPAALRRKRPEREYRRCLDGEAEAHLIALVCGQDPEGKDRWTLRLLQKRMVELAYVPSVSHETIRSALKETSLCPG